MLSLGYNTQGSIELIHEYRRCEALLKHVLFILHFRTHTETLIFISFKGQDIYFVYHCDEDRDKLCYCSCDTAVKK